MRKVLLTILCMALTFGLSMPMAAEAESSVLKTLSAADGDLGDTVTVTLDVVNDEVSALTVVDELPDGLKYIPGTFEVDGSSVTPSTVGQVVSTDVGMGTFTITFDVQVVEAPAEEVTVTNWARLYDDTVLADSDSEDMTIYPYGGFTKEVLLSTTDPWDDVPIGTDVHWLLLIAVENIDTDDIENMENPVVKDRSGCSPALMRPITRSVTARSSSAE